MDKLKHSVFACLILLAGMFCLPVYAADVRPGEEITAEVQVSAIPQEGSRSFDYSVSFALSPVDGAPSPFAKELVASQKKQTVSFLIPLTKAGIYEYRLVPKLISGKAQLQSDDSRMIRIWRMDDGKIGMKTFHEGDPYEATDTVYVVIPEKPGGPVRPAKPAGPVKPGSSSSGTKNVHTSVQSHANGWLVVWAAAGLLLMDLVFVSFRKTKELTE